MADSSPVFRRWYFGAPPVVLADARIQHLENRARELEIYLGQLQDRIEFGPVPGCYIYLPFRVMGAVAVAATADRIAVKKTPSFEMIPIAVSVVNGSAAGTATVQIHVVDSSAVSTALLTTPIVSSLATSGFNKRGDFTMKRITDVTFFRVEVTAITGAPTDLRGGLWVKDVSKVESV